MIADIPTDQPLGVLADQQRQMYHAVLDHIHVVRAREDLHYGRRDCLHELALDRAGPGADERVGEADSLAGDVHALVLRRLAPLGVDAGPSDGTREARREEVHDVSYELWSGREGVKRLFDDGRCYRV